jgi:hypothetical protein
VFLILSSKFDGIAGDFRDYRWTTGIIGYRDYRWRLSLSVTLYSIPNLAINIRITPIGRFCLSDGSTGAARLRGRREIAATIGHLGIP